MFNINTILTKKVQIYFEVMINYIIAVTSHARRDNLIPFCSYHLPFSQMILLASWIHIGLILCSQPLLNSNTLHQTRCVWFALAPVLHLPWWFSTVFICKSRQTTNVSEMTRICSCSTCSTFYGAEQFLIAESHCFSTKPTLWMLCGRSCMAFWSATSIMILYWFNNSNIPYFSLTTNQTKQLNPFLVETAACEFTIAALHHYSCFASMTLPYFMYFIKHALEFGKVRIKLLEMTFKGKQNIFHNQQPLHWLILTFRSNDDACCNSFSASTIDLHVDSARITGSCASSCVILVVPVLLIYSFCVWDAVNVSM